MSLVKAHDVIHVRFRAPDLGVMRSFLDDFGMLEAISEPHRLFMRGEGAAPFVHATEQGEPGFAGFGLGLTSLHDLEIIAAHDGVAIEPFDAPGGGHVARLIDPDGFVVEVVAGQTPAAPAPIPTRLPWNEGPRHQRLSQFRRVPQGPAHVMRLGHVVLGVSDFRASEAWYKDRFGFLTSDEIQPVPGVAIGAFMRADRGAVSSDHHTLFLFQHPRGPGFMHAAFEVRDVDDLMAGHKHLHRKGRHAVWGVGRHVLGSQVFDYWNDPWGHEVEHWTDGDQLVAADGGGIAPLDQLLSVQWGMERSPPSNDQVAAPSEEVAT
jgi:catechol 2,3-dioxygenase-like lactoylglutathione lyase family enzyme